MRTCVIFNPSAKGQKAERLRSRLDIISQHARLKDTAHAGDARRLATEAIAEGCDTIIAAGGDGTVNEVLNGIGDANAFSKVRLGVLPLGTVNVFALELGIPFNVRKAWDLIVRGRYTRIDLGQVEYANNGKTQRRYFAQLAGAGLDAKAIELVNWQQKKEVGSLAYVVAGLKAMRGPLPKVTVTVGHRSLTGELALIGNGKLYGGRMKILHGASLRDGLLDVCVFPRVRMLPALGKFLLAAVLGRLPRIGVERLRAAEFTITGDAGTPFEVDGEYVGHVPATFSVEKEKLRVIIP